MHGWHSKRVYAFQLLWVCAGIASGMMRLDAYALAGIMQCIIVQWNDPYLVSLNPNMTYVSSIPRKPVICCLT